LIDRLKLSFYFSRKISQYVPSELAKVYEKAVHRQTGPAFNPKIFIDFILEDKDVGRTLSDDEKNQLIDRYLEVLICHFLFAVNVKILKQFSFFSVQTNDGSN